MKIFGMKSAKFIPIWMKLYVTVWCPELLRSSSPSFQYVLKTRARCECVAHIIQSLTELDPSTTVISVDGVGAFDSVSRSAMLSGLLDMEEGERLLPFVRLFYSQPSSYLFDDEVGETHTIHQGEGGEQSDALMPLLFSLGQQRALRAIAGKLKDGERLFVFLDDLYVSCQPARVAEIHRVMRIELWTHSKISIHHGKTKLWNKAGILPSGVEELQQLASSVDENAIVWRGNPLLQTSVQGVKILGTPIGHEAFVKAQLMARRADHDVLLERIPAVPDLQAAWLLLSYCASAKANFALRTVRPDLVGEFCASVASDLSRRTVSLPFSRGGLVIQSASRTHPAAFWASCGLTGWRWFRTAPGSRASDHQRNAPWLPVRVHSRCGAVPRGPQ